MDSFMMVPPFLQALDSGIKTKTQQPKTLVSKTFQGKRWIQGRWCAKHIPSLGSMYNGWLQTLSLFSQEHRWHLPWLWGALSMQHNEFWHIRPSWTAATLWLPVKWLSFSSTFAGQHLAGITQASTYQMQCCAATLGSLSSQTQSGKILRHRSWFWASSTQLINAAESCKSSGFENSGRKITKSSFSSDYTFKMLHFSF